jgi:DNA-directed RNA polymerase subunit RPC12/RpoP
MTLKISGKAQNFWKYSINLNNNLKSKKMSEQKCLDCQGELEYASGTMYARCKSCNSLFMNMNNILSHYPVDESTRPMIEQALGFTPSKVVEQKPVAPSACPICTAALDVVEKDDSVLTRCTSCGALSQVKGVGGMVPIIVTPPGGGWNPEFQAMFEEELGFTYKLRKMPIGIPE